MRKLAAAVFFVATAAHAGPRASAVELFAHGRALAAEGKCADAIPFFLDTLKIEASIGALLNLAECHDKLHDDSRAYVRYREAEALAREKADDRESLARARADALAPRVARVVVTAPVGVHVTLDGTDARAGENVVTEGDHAVHASADGKRPWDGVAHATTGRAEPVVVPSLAPIEIIVEPPSTHAGSAQRTAGIVLTAFGAASLAAGGIFGGLAIAKKNEEVSLATGASQQKFDDAK
ncbi:MAG TPA: hypothetical protein VGH87_27150, partial [Polyangiaceae bacterium]